MEAQDRPRQPDDMGLREGAESELTQTHSIAGNGF
jgi:hypothetical protein